MKLYILLFFVFYLSGKLLILPQLEPNYQPSFGPIDAISLPLVLLLGYFMFRKYN